MIYIGCSGAPEHNPKPFLLRTIRQTSKVQALFLPREVVLLGAEADPADLWGPESTADKTPARKSREARISRESSFEIVLSWLNSAGVSPALILNILLHIKNISWL